MLKPLYDRVLVKPITEEEEKTKSGLILPSGSSNDIKGKIVAVGPDIVDELKVDDLVIYDKHTAKQLTIDGEVYNLMDPKNIHGII